MKKFLMSLLRDYILFDILRSIFETCSLVAKFALDRGEITDHILKANIIPLLGESKKKFLLTILAANLPNLNLQFDLLVGMNLRLYIICIAVLLALGVPATPSLGIPFLEESNITATVHGATYSWDTLEPLNNTVISVNSNPPQSIVAKDSTYSFELPPGDYTITARYYHNNTLVYSKEAPLEIESEGNYVFDLLLYPASENPTVGPIADETSDLNSVTSMKQVDPGPSIINYLSVAFILFLLLGGGYKFSRRHKMMNETGFQERKLNVPGLVVKVFGRNVSSGMRSGCGNIERVASVTEPVVKEPIIEPADKFGIETAASKIPLSADLREVMDIIRGHRGRITQKDLRSKLEYSEVKVSLMLSELEKRGLIRKFKNGRENIVVLIDGNH